MNMKYFKPILGLLVLGTAAIVSCNKDLKNQAPYTAADSSAYFSFVKVINATVGAARNYVYSPSIPSAVTGAVFAYGGTAPGSSYTGSSFSNNYFAINPGPNTVYIKDTLSTSTQPILQVARSFTQGTYYSIFTYDTTTTIQYAFVQDMLTPVTDTAARVRLGNFARGATKNVDIFSKVMNANVFTNISPTTVTAFVPYTSKQTDTLYVRETGTTNLLFQFNSFIPDQKRYYTLVFRGRQDNLGSNTRALTAFLNY